MILVETEGSSERKLKVKGDSQIAMKHQLIGHIHFQRKYSGPYLDNLHIRGLKSLQPNQTKWTLSLINYFECWGSNPGSLIC
jgi:hypothetical protein